MVKYWNEVLLDSVDNWNEKVKLPRICLSLQDDGGWEHAYNRRSLTFDNLRKLLVVYCNKAE